MRKLGPGCTHPASGTGTRSWCPHPAPFNSARRGNGAGRSGGGGEERGWVPVGGGEAWRQAPVLKEKALLVAVRLRLGWQGQGVVKKLASAHHLLLPFPIATSPSASGQWWGEGGLTSLHMPSAVPPTACFQRSTGAHTHGDSQRLAGTQRHGQRGAQLGQEVREPVVLPEGTLGAVGSEGNGVRIQEAVDTEPRQPLGRRCFFSPLRSY